MLAANRSWLRAALRASGCARAGPVPERAPSPQATAAPLRIQLRFGPEAELDLWVSDLAGEGGETLDFANPRSNATGGALDADRRCGDPVLPRIETIAFQQAPPGRYRIGVDFPERCGLVRGPVPRCPSASSCGTGSAGNNAGARLPWESSSRG